MFKKAKENKKGFTLAELLIVVAIIAVLVAISIPIFTSQLEKSRDSVSVANIRAAYAEASVAVLTDDTTGTSGNVTVTKTEATSGSTYSAVVAHVVIKSEKADNWSGLSTELPWNQTTVNPADPGVSGKYPITFAFDANGVVTSATLGTKES